MVLQPGEMVGQYRVEAQIGTGGMATVYKAYHPKLDRYVAIKMMHQTLMSDEAFHARFEREARIVAKLEHPNIVPIFDFSEHDKNPYLVMKHIDGRTLKNLLKQGALPLEEIRRIITAVASALDYAHKQGVLHRDVKPSNIILDENGTPYLTDFGLARIAEAGESTMSADMMLGTPHYISPEQARGEKTLDARTDIYSFAVILYELLVGRVPFSADTAYATVHDHIYTAPPLPSSINPDITPEVEDVLLRALAKDPEDRFATAGEMVKALESALNSSGLETASRGQVNVTPTPSTFHQRPTYTPPVPPKAPEPPSAPDPSVSPLGYAGHVFMNTVGKEIDKAIREEMEKHRHEGGKSRREERRERKRNRRDGDKNHSDWKPGTQWVKTPDGEWGFYTPDEIREFEEIDSTLTEEERIRIRVGKRMKERSEYMGHLTSYVMVNLMMWGIWLFTSGGFPPWPMWVTFGWGIGMAIHTVNYFSRYGGGRDRMEEAIQREIERERERSGIKSKNEDLYNPEVGVRLTEDGELTDSYVEEAEHKRKRR